MAVVFELFEVLGANGPDQFKQDGRPLTEPNQRLLADLVMFRIARLHIGLVQCIEPSAFLVLITWKGFGQPAVLLLGE